HGAGGRLSGRPRRPVRRARRAERMREVHAALAGRRPPPAVAGRRAVRRRAGDGADAAEDRDDLPGGEPPAVALGHRQRRVPPEAPPRAEGRAPRPGRPHAGTDRARRLRGPAPAPAVRRHEAARVDRARPGAGPGRAPDGRALRLARRADAHGPGRRTAPHLVGDAKDRAVRDAQPERGGVPRRSRRRAERATRQGHRRRGRGSAAAAQLRDDVERALRPPEGPHLAAHPECRAAMTWPERHRRSIQAALYLGILAAWEVLPRAGVVPRLFVPPLSEAIGTLVTEHRESLGSLPVTLGEIAVAYAIACGGGIASGQLIGASAAARRMLLPVLRSAYAVPLVVLYPVMMVWFGLGSESKIAFAS